MGVRQGKMYSFSICHGLKRSPMFFENASLHGLETVSNCIEDKLNIYLKLFALLYAEDTVLNSLTISNSHPFNVNFILVDCLPLDKTITLVLSVFAFILTA
jgi:hypothetical protein